MYEPERLPRSRRIARPLARARVRRTDASQTLLGYALLIALLGVALLGSAAQATPLEDASAQMQPGDWAEFPTIDLTVQLLQRPNNDQILHHVFEYTEDIKWFYGTSQLFFIGGGHNDGARFLTYTEDNNTWQEHQLNGNNWSTFFSHAYDHTALDEDDGVLYHRQPQSDRLEIFDIGSQTWSRSTTMSSGVECCGALEYSQALGKVIYVDGSWGVSAYDPRNDSWSSIAGSLSMGNYHNFAEYNPRHKTVIFGGGGDTENPQAPLSNDLFKLDQNGRVSRQGDAPVVLGTTFAVVTYDPVNGDYLVLAGDGTFWAYDVVNDRWAELVTQVPDFLTNQGVFGVVAAPIPEAGVVAFIRYNFGADPKFFIFKVGDGIERRPWTPSPSSRGGTKSSAVNSGMVLGLLTLAAWRRGRS